MNIKKHKFLPVSFSVNKEHTEKDTRFIDVTIDVMHTGLNLNGSIFNKEVVEENIESIKNTPIVGYIKYDENDEPEDFTKHEYKIVERDGERKYIYTGAAFGVIYENCQPRWIKKVASDGVEREYLQVDGLMWTKFSDATDLVKKDGIKNESMELELSSIEGFEDENNIFHFTKFKFDGCCLLSSTDDRIQPAMVGGQIAMNFDTSAIFDEIKEKLSIYFSQINNSQNFSNEDDIDGTNNSFQKKEVKDLGEKLKLLQEYNLTVESLDFNIEEISIEDLKVKLDEFEAKKIEDKEKDFALAEQFKEELIEKLSVETIVSEWDSEYQYPKYSYVDYDGEKLEVYVFDRQDWKLYGFAFAKNGDSVDIDFETKKRKKIAFEDFDEGVSTDFSIEGITKDVFEGIIAKSKTDIETLQSEFETYKETYKTEEAEVEKLREFKSAKLTEERKLSEDEIFSNFEEKLANVEEFKILKENCSELSLDDIEKECYAILGRQNFTFSKQTKKENKTPKLPIHTPTHDELLYGGIFAQYGKGGK